MADKFKMAAKIWYFALLFSIEILKQLKLAEFPISI